MRLSAHRRLARWGLWSIAISWGLLALLAVFSNAVHAESIPHEAARYQRDLTRQARLVWGLDAPVSTFAAQIHTESLWHPEAASPVGARGLAQFMPATERWIAGAYPSLNTPGADSGAADSAAPWGALNPAWALRALVTYDRWLWDRIAISNGCERMAMVLSSYNGGLGWVQRDRALAVSRGADGSHWFGGVDAFNAGRSKAAFAENRAYPRLILKVREPMYETAAWGAGSC